MRPEAALSAGLALGFRLNGVEGIVTHTSSEPGYFVLLTAQLVADDWNTMRRTPRLPAIITIAQARDLLFCHDRTTNPAPLYWSCVERRHYHLASDYDVSHEDAVRAADHLVDGMRVNDWRAIAADALTYMPTDHHHHRPEIS